MRLILLLLAAIVAGCGENAQQPLAHTRELKVLTRVGSTSYAVDERNGATGFDHDLVRMFATNMDLRIRFIVAASDDDIARRLKNGEAHMAAAWQSTVDDPGITSSAPYFHDHDVLVTHEAALPLTGIEQLANRTIHVVAGSRQEKAVRELRKKIPGIIIVGSHIHSDLDLLEGVAAQRFEATVANDAAYNIGSNFYPELQESLEIGSARPVVWLFAPGVDPQLITGANAFLEHIRKNGEMNRLKDRYFGHVERLTQADSIRFIERMRTVLAQYRPLFHAAQTKTGIDWRLLAAVAYQESQWDPLATSPTGVRGMMMLTEDTADLLGVRNRLDAAQSVDAGAQYISDLRDSLPASIVEPDRLWLALAAYNLGMGHLNAARHIAKTQKLNPDSWYAMKKALPLLGLPQYYSRLKSGKGRGGEAVIMVENIRVYTDILDRYERPYNPLEHVSVIGGGQRGLRSKQAITP